MSADLERKIQSSWERVACKQTLLFWPSLLPTAMNCKFLKRLIVSFLYWATILLNWDLFCLRILTPLEFKSPFWISRQIQIWPEAGRKLVQQDDVARNFCERLKVAILLLCDSSDGTLPPSRKELEKHSWTQHIAAKELANENHNILSQEKEVKDVYLENEEWKKAIQRTAHFQSHPSKQV